MHCHTVRGVSLVPHQQSTCFAGKFFTAQSLETLGRHRYPDKRSVLKNGRAILPCQHIMQRLCISKCVSFFMAHADFIHTLHAYICIFPPALSAYGLKAAPQ